MQTAAPPPNRARIAPLAVLPVFFDLRGKRVVVIGGSPACAWKAELLAAAGARVDVYAPQISAELRSLAPLPLEGRGRGWGSIGDPPHHPLPSPPLKGEGASAPQPSGQINIHPRPWAPPDLANAALAIADCPDDGQARAFAAAASAAGLPYNVIDRPEFCQFQFGAIVNRSPVVVGISTAGAAPILGQAVRRRIEVLLPGSLALWAQLAARLRDAVMARLAPGQQRRTFWERLAERAFSGRAPGPEDADPAFAAAPVSGRVTLVGAGPGDADLLTIKAVRALQSADIILFDPMIAAPVLELARREAQRIPAGADRAKVPEEVAKLMAEPALAGKHVVRLVAGDPAGSNRARAEAAMLESRGIAVSLVPGTTALPGPDIGSLHPEHRLQCHR